MTPQASRPRPRIAGTPNPAMKQQQSPYGDTSRIVPKKLGMRTQAAQRLQNKKGY